MFGYATDETDECMPLTAVLSHKLNARLAKLRRTGDISWARPDSKTQVCCTALGRRFLYCVRAKLITHYYSVGTAIFWWDLICLARSLIYIYIYTYLQQCIAYCR